MSPINILLTGLPSASTLCLRVGDIRTSLDQPSLAAAVTAATGLPSSSFYLRSAGALLCSHSLVTQPGQHTVFVELFLRRALPGGKGGFGATLKGSSATKVTTNFDACRDIHGRRLRDVRHQAAIAEYLRTHRIPDEKSLAQVQKKRPRTPVHDDGDVLVPIVDTKQLDETIDAVNRDVEDAVAVGLRAAVDKRKKQRLPHSRRSLGPGHANGTIADLLSSDSDDSGTDLVLPDREGSSFSRKH